MAAELQHQFPDARIDLLPSRGGRFEVMQDGRAIFEKSKLGRHAEPGEVLRLIERAKGSKDR